LSPIAGLAHAVVNKSTEQNVPEVELCGTPEETRKGRQKLPKIRIKETA
jgi:hypothetical protein